MLDSSKFGHNKKKEEIPMLYKDFQGLKLSALGALPEDKRPSACVGCGSCEAVCPQQLKIPAAMADFVQRVNKH